MKKDKVDILIKDCNAVYKNFSELRDKLLAVVDDQIALYFDVVNDFFKDNDLPNDKKSKLETYHELIEFSTGCYDTTTDSTCEFDGTFIKVIAEEDTENLKKSHKGIVHVMYDSNGELFETDQHDKMLDENKSALKTVFKDGILMNKQTFTEIRERQHNINSELRK